MEDFSFDGEKTWGDFQVFDFLFLGEGLVEFVIEIFLGVLLGNLWLIFWNKFFLFKSFPKNLNFCKMLIDKKSVYLIIKS